MYKIAFAVCLSAVAALPLEDTAEVKAAKDAFATVYKTVEAGEHINLMPVNNDVQAPQIANAYLDDTMDVAEAKEAFMAAFRNAGQGGQGGFHGRLQAMQAPAPKVAEPVEVAAPAVAPVAVYNTLPYHHMAYNNFAYNHVVPATYAVPRVAVPATYKVKVPATYAVPHTYGYGYPTVYAHGFPYVMPTVLADETGYHPSVAETETVEAVEMA